VTFLVNPVRVERDVPSERARFQDPWVPYPAGIEAVKAMAGLIKRPHEGRPQNLAIVGEPNFGKSHLLDYFVDHYPDLPDAPFPRVQVLAIDTPAKADGAALVRELMSAMGARYNSREPLDELIRKFCIRAESLQILLFILDEFNNGAWGRRDAAMTLIHAVRSISNRLRRPIVIAGTTALDEVLRNDGQLNERFRRIHLPRWTETQDVMDLLTTFEQSLNMPKASGLGSAPLCEVVINITGPKLGRIACLLREAKRIALASNAECIDKIHLHAAAPLLPGSATT
jgi:hypothetical protein